MEVEETEVCAIGKIESSYEERKGRLKKGVGALSKLLSYRTEGNLKKGAI